jgi:hypothetical protein
MRERAPNVGLKQHDDGENDVGQKISNQPIDRLQMPPAGDVEHQHQQRRAGGHLNGARAPDRLQHLVDHQRDDGDIEDVPPGHGGQTRNVWQPVQHLCAAIVPAASIASATRTTSIISDTLWTRTM